MTRSARAHIPTAVVLLAVVAIGSPLLAQPAVRVTMPASAFTVEGSGRDVTIDDVGGGRRFRGKAFAKVIVKGALQIPPSASTDPRLQRLVVHFRTSPSGPSLRSVELRNGANSAFLLQTHVEGDYTAREATEAGSANAWDFQRGPVRVYPYPQSMLRFEVQFPGGFDSQINPGEFVLTSVVVDFRRNAALTTTTTSAAVITSAAGVTAGGTGMTTGTTVTAGVGRGRGRLIEPGAAASPALVPASAGVIYALTANNDLLWYRHDGRDDGAARWAVAEAKTVGTGWTFKHVFPGGDGVIYAITDTGDLLWYRHDGRGDGSFRWAAEEGRKVGTGWNFKHVFSGGDGVIYAITDNDDLLWYRHDGRGDGSFRWAAGEGRKVGTGWTFKHVFSGGDGVIYALTDNNDLLWYRHDGRGDGSFRWAAGEGRKVGTGWTFKHVFSGGDGVIYAVTETDDLLWYRHDGRGDGSFRWAASAGKRIGTGWTFKNIF